MKLHTPEYNHPIHILELNTGHISQSQTLKEGQLTILNRSGFTKGLKLNLNTLHSYLKAMNFSSKDELIFSPLYSYSAEQTLPPSLPNQTGTITLPLVATFSTEEQIPQIQSSVKGSHHHIKIDFRHIEKQVENKLGKRHPDLLKVVGERVNREFIHQFSYICYQRLTEKHFGNTDSIKAEKAISSVAFLAFFLEMIKSLSEITTDNLNFSYENGIEVTTDSLMSWGAIHFLLNFLCLLSFDPQEVEAKEAKNYPIKLLQSYSRTLVLIPEMPIFMLQVFMPYYWLTYQALPSIRRTTWTKPIIHS
ncbi:MAG TPA: hypothetical protein VD999_05545 [Vitreimonas sp.]|nr:hypothetical protein [Vitreimonas sp.]